MLETLFGSKLRAKIPGRLFTRSGERYFVRQLAATIGEDSTCQPRTGTSGAGRLAGFNYRGTAKILSSRPEIAAVQGYPGVDVSSTRRTAGFKRFAPPSPENKPAGVNWILPPESCSKVVAVRLSSCVLTSNRRVTSMCLWSTSRSTLRPPIMFDNSSSMPRHFQDIPGVFPSCEFHKHIDVTLRFEVSTQDGPIQRQLLNMIQAAKSS